VSAKRGKYVGKQTEPRKGVFATLRTVAGAQYGSKVIQWEIRTSIQSDVQDDHRVLAHVELPVRLVDRFRKLRIDSIDKQNVNSAYEMTCEAKLCMSELTLAQPKFPSIPSHVCVYFVYGSLLTSPRLPWHGRTGGC
jgi:hypothetical protein